LVIEHLRLHAGVWPKSWDELRATCADTGTMMLSTNADTEIEELRKRIEIDWSVDPERIRQMRRQGEKAPVTLVRLKNSHHDWMVGAEPNQMIWDYLAGVSQPGRAPSAEQPTNMGMSSGLSEAAKKEAAYQQFRQEAPRFLTSFLTNMLAGADKRDVTNLLAGGDIRDVSNFWNSADGDKLFRDLFEANWIHSSFGLRWDEIPPPTIRGSNATVELDRFVSEHGWNMLTNDAVLLFLIREQGDPIKGLPWEAIRERTFKAATQQGILFIPLRGVWPSGASGLAYNPHTNRFHFVREFKHIGDHWYVWQQSDSGDQSFYEGEPTNRLGTVSQPSL
jgi:hypothetical protein